MFVGSFFYSFFSCFLVFFLLITDSSSYVTYQKATQTGSYSNLTIYVAPDLASRIFESCRKVCIPFGSGIEVQDFFTGPDGKVCVKWLLFPFAFSFHYVFILLFFHLLFDFLAWNDCYSFGFVISIGFICFNVFSSHLFDFVLDFIPYLGSDSDPTYLPNDTFPRLQYVVTTSRTTLSIPTGNATAADLIGCSLGFTKRPKNFSLSQYDGIRQSLTLGCCLLFLLMFVILPVA
jgi:hypothetical protein